MTLEDAKEYFLGKEVTTNYYEDPVTFQEIHFYKGFVMPGNHEFRPAGFTLIVYEATTTSGDTVYCGVTYSNLTTEENGELKRHGMSHTEYFNDPEEVKIQHEDGYLFEQGVEFETID